MCYKRFLNSVWFSLLNKGWVTLNKIKNKKKRINKQPLTCDKIHIAASFRLHKWFVMLHKQSRIRQVLTKRSLHTHTHTHGHYPTLHLLTANEGWRCFFSPPAPSVFQSTSCSIPPLWTTILGHLIKTLSFSAGSIKDNAKHRRNESFFSFIS